MNACLYDRLGGAATVAAVVDDAVDRHAANPALTSLFCGKDLPQLKALFFSLLSARVAQPCCTGSVYPALQDADMGFSPAELQALIDDMTAALREQGLGTSEVGEIIKLLYADRATLRCDLSGNESRTLAA